MRTTPPLRLWTALACGLLLGAASTGAATAAYADDDASSASPTEVMAQLAPDQTTAASPDGAVAVAAPASSNAGTEVTLTDESAAADLKITLPDDTSQVPADDGYAVFTNDTSDLATWVKPAPDGGQVIFYATSDSATSDLTVTLPQGIESKTQGEDGITILHLVDGESLALYPAWARDASGDALATEYQIEGNSITQVVQTDASTQFPVVADPAWSYTRHYSVATTTSATAKKALHRCMNCYFPVTGAPKAWPTPGTLLPLTVGPWNFHCTFRNESSSSSQGVTSWGYTFDAAKGHVDGLGSHIGFTFSDQRDGSHYLDVYAYIKNDNPAGVGRPAYTAGATVEWDTFAINMRNAK